MTMAGLYIVLALGLNVVVGFAGLLDLGYAAFYAVGAYSYALMSVHFHINFWLAIPLAGILAGAFGFLLGVITLRLRGDYLAIVTLGFIQILHLVLNNWDSVTRGPKGISGIPHPKIGKFIFYQPIDYYYLILAIVVVALFFIQRIKSSRIGRAWDAIREDEIAAEAMGIHTTQMKTLAFAIGAAWAGVCGTFFSAKFGFVSPESFTFFESILILSMVVLGGIGSIPGVILGALVLMILPEMMRGFSNYRMLLFGLAMILMMVLRPQGILGNFRRKIELS
ncbi:MAG: branched-chain amino acid ABC transporter permease [Nitrospirae bacterium]|nr:branched-chain amino acid ABC transporter permease [Nitrospirota bacterium]